MIQANDDKHEDAHSRIRGDYRDLEKRVMSLERAYTDTLLDFTRTKTALDERAKAPLDVLRIGMTLKLGISLAGAVATIIIGAYSSAAWVKSDITEIRNELNVSTRLQEERAGTTKTALDKLDAASRLQQMKIDEITTALKVKGIIKP